MTHNIEYYRAKLVGNIMVWHFEYEEDDHKYIICSIDDINTLNHFAHMTVYSIFRNEMYIGHYKPLYILDKLISNKEFKDNINHITFISS